MTHATQLVHWPGKDTPACDMHAEGLRRLGNSMGFAVSMTPIEGSAICTNCESEAKKAAQQRP